MANCDRPFKNFNDKIALADSYKKSLRTSRDDLRKKVRAKFKDKGYDVKFHGQGSFAMATTIKPADGDYDVDDGIYILQDQRPTESPATLHQWVVEAADDHTKQHPTDKNPCVRVHFKAGHHIDLVIYHKAEQAHPSLAHKRDGWKPSDPKEFKEWFDECARGKPQLRRLVRYFKGWTDNVKGQMPPGLILTILAVNHYHQDDRDDLAFLETMRAMYAALDLTFVCYRPTYPTTEDLFADYSDSRRRYFLERLIGFIRSGDQALAETVPREACKKWKRHFGDRFSCEGASEKLEDARSHAAQPFINTDARSA